MKTRYTKLLGSDLYIKEEKRWPWSPWKVVRSGGLIPIAFRHIGGGKFDPEWKYQDRLRKGVDGETDGGPETEA